MYPIISMRFKGQPLTVLIDSGASSSHITRKAANKLGVTEKIRKHPLLIYGFANSRSKPVTKFASLILVGARHEKIHIDFNIIESEIISRLPGVTAQIFDEFPHLLQHRRQLSTGIPRPDTEVDAIIGVKDKPKLMLNDTNNEINEGCPRNPCVMKNIDDTVKSVIQVQPTIFGDIVEGGINNAIEEYLPAGKKQGRGVDKIKDEYKKHAKETNDDNTFESILAVRDVPLDIL